MTRQLAFDLGARTALGSGDFLVADANREAVAWLERWPAWPAPALVVHGPAGSGKSHLAGLWAARAGAPVVAAQALAGKAPEAVCGGARAVAVDDAEQADEEALLHLYNVLAGAGGHLLLTATRPPARWSLALPDLASRLRAAAVVAVAAPDDALLAAVLVKLLADRQLRVREDVVLYLIARMERSFAAARGLVAALDRAALAKRSAITIPLAREVLARFDRTD